MSIVPPLATDITKPELTRAAVASLSDLVTENLASAAVAAVMLCIVEANNVPSEVLSNTRQSKPLTPEVDPPMMAKYADAVQDCPVDATVSVSPC